MTLRERPEITQILREWNDGDEDAKDQLLAVAYSELKRQAQILMSRERGDHTLQPTALVHEAFLRLDRQKGIDWKDRDHFYGVVSRLMRQILVDHARKHASAKRGNRPIRFSLDELTVSVERRADSFLGVNDALEQLEKLDGRQARIVEMRFFGGFSNSEIAAALEISEKTVTREWQGARLWLFRELNKAKRQK